MNNWGLTREIVYRASDEGGIAYPEDRLPKNIDIQSSPKGLYGETGELGPNYITGICLMPPRYSQNLEDGVNPVTGEELESYDEFQNLLKTDLPALSTLTDQFGLTELDEGKVVVTVEDEEWSDRLSNYLQDAGIKFDEDQLESEYEQEMNRLVQQYQKQVVKTIFSHLDNQDWREAERIAREEGGVNDKGWNTIVQAYIKHRLRRGQKKLKIIEMQLKQAEVKLEQADKAEILSKFEQYVKNAVQGYKKIEQDELLEAQRDISRAENVFKEFGSQAKGKKIFRKEHKDVNRLDKDVKQAEQDLQQLLDKLES